MHFSLALCPRTQLGHLSYLPRPPAPIPTGLTGKVLLKAPPELPEALGELWPGQALLSTALLCRARRLWEDWFLNERLPGFQTQFFAAEQLGPWWHRSFLDHCWPSS